MLLYKQKKAQAAKGNRILISITVLGSAGPIRFVVNEEELVAAVIDTALKSYAREGRLPVLGSDLNDFVLYCSNAGSGGKFIHYSSLGYYKDLMIEWLLIFFFLFYWFIFWIPISILFLHKYLKFCGFSCVIVLFSFDCLCSCCRINYRLKFWMRYL